MQKNDENIFTYTVEPPKEWLRRVWICECCQLWRKVTYSITKLSEIFLLMYVKVFELTCSPARQKYLFLLIIVQISLCRRFTTEQFDRLTRTAELFVIFFSSAAHTPDKGRRKFEIAACYWPQVSRDLRRQSVDWSLGRDGRPYLNPSSRRVVLGQPGLFKSQPAYRVSRRKSIFIDF